MRKYHQLILIIISLLSVCLLLIYRHEYNRLRYVLEVFNFFGQPTDCTFPDIINSTNKIQHDWGPAPIWTSDENYSIYSAFLTNENDVEAIVVHEENKIVIKTCYLWIEDRHNAIIGKVKYSKIEQLSDNNNILLALYKYYCHGDAVPEVPYAVSFSNNNKFTNDVKKIMLSPLLSNKKQHLSVTICVIPTSSYSKQQIVEFISFHKIIGVDSFIIYNNNIPYKFINILQKLSIKLGIEIINFPWNYPYPSSSKVRNIIEEDCLHRTKDKSHNVLILDWNELIVPKHHHSISKMLDNYDQTNRTHRFALQVFKFCLENNDRREPAVLHSIYYDDTKSNELIFIHRNNNYQLNNNVIINTQEISSSVAAVHRYIKCDTYPSNNKMESVMLKYSNDMRKSTLFKLFKYNRF